MNYSETVDFLFHSLPNFEHEGEKGYKPGLERVMAMAQAVGNPHKNLKTIHVGGTNGKGSTSSLLASVLQEMGYKVGLFTSPHLIDFRERIRIGKDLITEEEVVDLVAQTRPLIQEWSPSFFEYATLIGFLYFFQKNVDFAIIEVGMGGRLDSTNIIDPLLSVITNISLDHTQFLGGNIESIATEKAGIIKPYRPVVLGGVDPSLYPLFNGIAKEKEAPLFLSQEEELIVSQKSTENGWEIESVHFGALQCPLSGDFQIDNIKLVLSALNILKTHYCLPISSQDVFWGFAHVKENSGLRGRWEKIAHEPTIICDTGHNPGSFSFIVQQVQKEPHKNLHWVLGMVSDKDVSGVLSLLPQKAHYYFTAPNTSRAFPAQNLFETAREYGLHGECYPTVEEALKKAEERADREDLIYIGGSNYVVAEALRIKSKTNNNN